MSYDLEINSSATRRSPLVDKSSGSSLNDTINGRSAEEIKELLEKVNNNIYSLEKYTLTLTSGKGVNKQQMKANEKLMLDCLNNLRRAKELIATYDRNDAPIYRRKLATISDRVEEVVKSIRDKEQRGLAEAKRSMNRLSEDERYQEEDKKEKKQLLLKLEGEVKVLEEADYINDVIDERQAQIDKIGNIMNGIRDISQDFNMEVEAQGEKLVNVDNNMENVAGNTKEATKQLQQADKRSKSTGKCLIIIAAIIFCALGALVGILFATGTI
ncbi:unnamed protein product [Moneuplotes crassus]|uniref:t-SNARE coiled-coil homology domain-containing protein n=1 Tax=Euplotes crassus TaxID=5936 RepID=A0AAD1XJC8_EUPCR|nr:unnamed protein product [Moneuplotes crassus]